MDKDNVNLNHFYILKSFLCSSSSTVFGKHLSLRFLNEELAALVLLLVNSLYIRLFVLTQLFLYDFMKNADCYAHMPDLKSAISRVSTQSQSVCISKNVSLTLNWAGAILQQRNINFHLSYPACILHSQQIFSSLRQWTSAVSIRFVFIESAVKALMGEGGDGLQGESQ